MFSLRPGYRRHARTAAISSIFALATLLQAQNVVDLPFETDFEADAGYAPGSFTSDSWWNFEEGLFSEINDFGLSGSQSLNFEGGQWLTLDTNGLAPSQVTWVDFFLKPVYAGLEDLPTEIPAQQSAITGFVKLNTEGEVYAVDGDGLGGGEWTPSGSTTALNGNIAQDWIRLTYRLDYASKKWDLYVDGQMQLADLGFLDNAAEKLTQFAARADADDPTSLDYFYAGEENPLFADSSGDGLPDDWLTAQGLSIYSSQRYGDGDLDGLNNLLEYQLSTRADLADTDGDGVHDGAEYAAGFSATAADSYVLESLPFSENFEAYAPGSLNAQGLWNVNGSANIQTENVFSGNQALSLGAASAADTFVAGSGQGVVWVDVYLKPRLSETTPKLPVDATSGYYFDADGKAVAFDGIGSGSGFWKLLDAAASGDWRRVTAKLDYATQSYDLYIDGGRVAENFGFANAQPFFSRLSLDGDVAEIIDDLSVSLSEPQLLDDDRDGLVNAEEASLGTSSTVFDSDSDGLADSLESVWSLNPLVADTSLASLSEIEPGVHEWSTTFSVNEGYMIGALNAQKNWTANGLVEVSADESVTVTDAIDADTSFERLAGIGEERRMWVSFRAKLLTGEMPDVTQLNEPAVALWGFKAANTLVVWDEASQAWLEFTTADDATEWNDYSVYLDYVNQTWMICQNGVIVANELPFKDQNLIVFSRFKALQAKVEDAEPTSERSTASFDDVTFSNTEPAGMDFDGDGLENAIERQIGSNLLLADSDGDGMDDFWEYQNGLNLLVDDASADSDNDGLSNAFEYAQGSNPQAIDSDGDGFSDVDEYYAGTSAVDSQNAPEAVNVAPWSIADVGNVSGAKGYTVDGRYVLYAKGSGVSRDDRLGFFYQEFTGDFEIALRAYSAEGGIVGVMARSSLDDSDLMATGVAQQRGGYKFYGRSTFGAQPSSPYLGGKHFPNTYVKLQRTGSRFTAYRSTDGENWSPMGNLTVNAGNSILAGIVFASGSNSELRQAEVEVISVVRDSDSDGISDSDEALYGTLANNADTDGDGVSDYDELFVIFSNPLVADFDGTETIVASATGSAFTNSLGNWQREGDVAYAREQRGWVEYTFDTLETGSFRFDVTGGQNNAYSDERRFDLVLYVDGQRVDSSYLEAGYGESDAASFFLPQLFAGSHTLRIEWINGAPGTSLRLDSVSLASLGGEDADGNGVVDWLDSRLAATSDFDETTVYTSISPYTLEGSTSHVSFVRVTSNYEPNPAEPETVSVQQGLQGDYFAHIDLAPDTDTTVSVSEQNDLITFDKTVIWTPLNLLESEDLLIRAGDSLLLSAFTREYQTDEATSITVSDGSMTETYSLTAAEAAQHEFATAGNYTLTATLTPSAGDPISATVAVEVVGVSFGTAPRVVVGDTRDWTAPGVPEEAFLEADSFIYFSEKSPVDGSRRFSLSTNSTSEGTILARLGEDGPILGRTTLYPLVNYHYTEPRWSIVDTFEDGTELWSASINLGGDVPDDIEVHIRIFKAGVTFLDGSVEMTITKDDLDELGVFRYYMLRSPESRGSTCHTTTVYQDGERIGAPY